MKIKVFLFTLLPVLQLLSQSPTERFDAAMDLFNLKLFEQANQKFEQILTDHSLSDELFASAKFYSGESLFNLGKRRESLSAFEYLKENFRWTEFRSKALYRLGIIYFDLENYENCRENLITLLDSYPLDENTGSALYWIGESYSRQNKLEDAVKFLEEAIEDKKNNSFVDYSLFTLANIYEKIGDYESAVIYYDKLLSYHKDSPLALTAQIRIGICYFNLKDYQSSILELNNPLLSDLPEELYSQSLYLLANSYYRTQEYANAEKSYLEIIKVFPGSNIINEAKYGLAWSYFQQKKFNDAFKVFNFLSEGTDSIAEKSFYWKAESKRYAGQELEAFELFTQFIKQYPQSSLVQTAQYQMGALYYNGKNYDLASRYLITSTSSIDPIIRARANTLLGEIELNKKQFTSAKNYFEPVLSITDNTSDVQKRALLGLGIALYNTGQFPTAIEHLSDLEMLDPLFEKDKVNFYIAENYYSLEKFNDALNHFQKVDIQNPDVGAMALYGKAYCNFNLNDYENAVYNFQDFIKNFPSNDRMIDSKLRLAESYYGSKNYAASSKVYKDLFKLGGSAINNAAVYYQYAQALYKANEKQSAILEFQNLQEKFPSSEFADKSLFTVAWIYFQEGDFNSAIDKYHFVLMKYPKSNLAPIVYYSIGDAFFNLTNYDSAIVNYEKVISFYPNSNFVFDAVNGIQYSYVAQEKPDQAIKLIEEFVNKNPSLSFSDQIYFKKGEIYYSSREYEKAKSSYQDFIVRFPKSKMIAEAYYWLGKSAQNLNQNDEAIIFYKKVFDFYPQSESAAGAVIEIGNIYNQLKNYEAAFQIFNSAEDKLSKSPKLAEIKFMKALTLINLNDLKQAGDVFDEVIQNYDGTVFADKSKLEMGILAITTRQYEDAAFYLKLLIDKRTDDLGAKAAYYLGLSLFEQKKFNEAILNLDKVRVSFSSYDEWVTKSLLLLGDCYVQIKDFNKAKEMYRAVVIKHRSDAFGQEAQSKLQEFE
ncbi:MAG TPA: tetratricopeptide repeat protein [Ignavibacteriaceae bacterium]|nr:tetratricopeptide repeat protein [Ignavibacteriaceae bacterium]